MRISRHEAHCTVCKRPDRAEIEEKYINWQSRIRLEEEYGLPRDSLYRHAKALSLNDRRQSNLIGALETIIERGLNTDISLRKTHGRITGEINFFHNQFKNFIFQRATDEVRRSHG